MKRTPVHLLWAFAALVAFIILVAVLNAPRMLDSYADIETAHAHQAAAEAMQTQANATILAVSGMLCLTAVLALLLLGGLLLLLRPTQPGRPPKRRPYPQPTYPWTPEDEAVLPHGMDWAAWDWPADDFPQ